MPEHPSIASPETHPPGQLPGGPRRHALSLRVIMMSALVAIVSLGVSAWVALIILTTSLGESARDLRLVVDTIRLTDALEEDLRRYSVARPTERQVIAEQIRWELDQIQPRLRTEEGRYAFGRASSAVETFLEDAAPGATENRHLQAAFEWLQTFIELKIAAADRSVADASAVQHLANLLGIGMVFVACAIMLWIWRIAFHPVLRVSDALRRYAAGQRDIRVAVEGPAEIREVAHRFNTMVSLIGRQRERQMVFLAGVAHDLRTPLNSLKAAAELIRVERHALDQDKARRVASLFRRQVDRMDHMLSDLLDAARIEAGALTVDTQPCDLRACARFVHDLFEASSPLHAIALDEPDHEVLVECDPRRIEQVLINLVSNALKYSPAGGPITIRVGSRADAASIEVADRGLGMSGDDIQRAFEPFHRAQADLSAVPGAGLGLSVSRKIVEAHGGSIEVESRLGKGSTFRVWLPAAPHSGT